MNYMELLAVRKASHLNIKQNVSGARSDWLALSEYSPGTCSDWLALSEYSPAVARCQTLLFLC